ncbi:MAG: hypothetical protein A2527_02475 [Candidatus Lambdaproteobacteria bacterium RIFOXYD2_FULL_50_16]|uniref:Uncharacterized protein n=1 Tax=Candidatus Lambdaproteobacteria bacterium RIFOXYD2_FULL_50_16 TaxID=1817772 RepID=A0A1F6GDZ6_9PROT|nr:MAG: hypothetical protein A2527_02475 [Candidatus Lambdaproteobacteria bacterium RIFOXYD2_FULL_50_16]
MACINHQPFEIRRINKNFKEFFPNSLVTPTNKTPMGITPPAQVGRKIAPGRACAHDPKDCIDKKAIVLGDAAPSSFSAGQMWFKFVPNMV